MHKAVVLLKVNQHLDSKHDKMRKHKQIKSWMKQKIITDTIEI